MNVNRCLARCICALLPFLKIVQSEFNVLNTPRLTPLCLHLRIIQKKSDKYIPTATNSTPSCQAGFRGANCDAICDKGFYGNDCALKCGQCSDYDGRCNPYTGYCSTAGCKPGWTGDLCKTKFVLDNQTNKCPQGKHFACFREHFTSAGIDYFQRPPIMNDTHSTTDLGHSGKLSFYHPLPTYVTLFIVVGVLCIVLTVTISTFSFRQTRIGRYIHVRMVFNKMCYESGKLHNVTSLPAKQRVNRLGVRQPGEPQIDIRMLSRRDRKKVFEELNRVLGDNESYDEFVSSPRFKEMRLAVANRLWAMNDTGLLPKKKMSELLPVESISNWNVFFKRRTSVSTSVDKPLDFKEHFVSSAKKSKSSILKKDRKPSKSKNVDLSQFGEDIVDTAKANVRFSGAASVVVISESNINTPCTSYSLLASREVVGKRAVSEILDDISFESEDMETTFDNTVDPQKPDVITTRVLQEISTQESPDQSFEEENAAISEAELLERRFGHRDSIIVRRSCLVSESYVRKPAFQTFFHNSYHNVHILGKAFACCGCCRRPSSSKTTNVRNIGSISMTMSGSDDSVDPSQLPTPEQIMEDINVQAKDSLVVLHASNTPLVGRQGIGTASGKQEKRLS